MTIAGNTTVPNISAGYLQRVAIRPEAAVGDSETLSTGWQELKVLSAGLSEEIERTDDNSKRGTLTLLETFDGKRTGAWTLEQRLRARADLGPKPSEHAILVAGGLYHTANITINTIVGVPIVGDVITGAAGSATIQFISAPGEYRVTGLVGYFTKGEAITFVGSGATGNVDTFSNTYAPIVAGSGPTGPAAPYSTIGLVSDTAAVGESLSGAYVKKMTWQWDGADSCKFMAEGMGRKKSYVGQSTTTGVFGPGAVNITVSNPERFEVGGLIQFQGDFGPSGSGYRITGISGSTITIPAPGLATGVANGAVVCPIFPTSTAQAGAICNATNGLILLDLFGPNVDVCSPSGSISMETEFGSNQDCFGRDTYTEAWPINRKVTGEIVAKFTGPHMKHIIASRKEGFTTTMMAVLGDYTNKGWWRIYLGNVQFDPVASLDIPEEDAVQVTYTLKSLGTGVGNNEIQVNQEA